MFINLFALIAAISFLVFAACISVFENKKWAEKIALPSLILMVASLFLGILMDNYYSFTITF